MSVKIGRTNGQPVLHLISTASDDRSSETIASEVDWDQHRWNRYNQPRKNKQTEEVAA